jgi:hypothetical protein
MKAKFISLYTTELIQDGDAAYIIQYSNDKDQELNSRKAIMARRDDPNYRTTEYFEKRCNNFIQKLFVAKTGTEFVEMLVKSSSVSMSSFFKYRDVLDIINQRKSELTFSPEEFKTLNLIEKSLVLNNVIAPKIKPIYFKLTGKVDDDVVEAQ